MVDDQDVVVDLEQEAQPEETKVVLDAPPEVKAKPEPDPAIEELKRQRDELKKRDEESKAQLRARDEETRRLREEAQKARQEAETAKSRVVDSHLDAVEAGISAAKSESGNAARAYQAAMEQGDFAAAAQAQEQIAEAAARRVRLEEARADIAARKAEPAPEKKAQEDPFDSYLNQFSGPTRDWMRNHRDWVTNPRKSAKLNAAHYDAIEAGHSADTPEYFEFVESQIGLRDKPVPTNGHDENVVEVRAHTRARKPVVAAPVQNTGGGTSGGGQTVTLTRGEHAAATDGTLVWNYNDPTGQNRFKKGDPIGAQEFARRKLAMQAQGHYDKNYTGDQ